MDLDFHVIKFGNFRNNCFSSFRLSSNRYLVVSVSISAVAFESMSRKDDDDDDDEEEEEELSLIVDGPS
jgi:hypothetical protein